MKKIIGLIFLVVLVFIGKKGMAVFSKMRHAGRLKVGVKKFRLLNIASNIKSQIILTIGNFSPSTFAIDQISIDAYTPTGELLAKQTNPLPQPLLLHPNQNNTLPLSYQVNTAVLLSEIKKIGGVSGILANYLTSGKYGLPIVLKGFVVSGSLQKEIHEPLNV